VDLSFTSFATLLFALASFNPTIRSSICEEISRQPQLSSELGEAGFDLEDCEPWLERSVMAGVGLMAIILVVRVCLTPNRTLLYFNAPYFQLQFTIVLTNVYRHLVHSTKGYRSLEDGAGNRSRRIFLLPHREDPSDADDLVVYAPVPLSSLSTEETHDLQATEAWFCYEDYRQHRRAPHRRSTSNSLPQNTHRRRQSLPPTQMNSETDGNLNQV
jgi:hypothetical protein